MKVKIYDESRKQVIWVKVDDQTLQIINDNKKADRKIKKQKKYEISLDKLIKKGVQIPSDFIVENVVAGNIRERKYLGSNDYKQFKNGLQKAIKQNFEKMSVMEKKVIFLRFYYDMSIGQIAKILNISKSTVQCYIQRGCIHLREFLDEDIKKNKRKLSVKN